MVSTNITKTANEQVLLIKTKIFLENEGLLLTYANNCKKASPMTKLI